MHFSIVIRIIIKLDFSTTPFLQFRQSHHKVEQFTQTILNMFMCVKHAHPSKPNSNVTSAMKISCPSVLLLTWQVFVPMCYFLYSTVQYCRAGPKPYHFTPTAPSVFNVVSSEVLTDSKEQTFITSNTEKQGAEHGFVQDFWPRLCHVAAVEVSVGAAVSWRLDWAGRPVSKFTPTAVLRKPQLLALWTCL